MPDVTKRGERHVRHKQRDDERDVQPAEQAESRGKERAVRPMRAEEEETHG